MKSQVIFLSAALVCACSQVTQEQQISERKMSVSVVKQTTKTTISGSSILFETGDQLRLVCEGYNNFYVSNAETGDVNLFEGLYRAMETSGKDCSWYAVYPAVLSVSENGVVTGTLPERQTAPFDPAANMMISNIVIADYWEDNQPPLPPLYMNQIMGLIQISFTNANADYANDYLYSAELSTSTALSGPFVLNIHDINPKAAFSGDTSNRVYATYSSEDRTQLGNGVSHTLYLFVNPSQISNATLTIKTNKHTFTYNSSRSFTPTAGCLTTLPLMDLKDFLVDDMPKTVAIWGSSSVSRNALSPESARVAPNEANFPYQLQLLLGEKWTVYNGGYNGWRLPNIIEKLEEWEETNDADLTVLYMERNGGYSSWQDCLNQQIAAISHLSNPDHFIVLGHHDVHYWQEQDLYPYAIYDKRPSGGSTYEGTFTAYFINLGRFQDLFHPVVNDWKEWLVRVGRYDTIGEISNEVEYPGDVGITGAVMIDSDGDGIKDKPLEWPQSFRWSSGDIHPSKWGAKAMAYMIYDKMYDLGYVDSPALPAL